MVFFSLLLLIGVPVAFFSYALFVHVRDQRRLRRGGIRAEGRVVAIDTRKAGRSRSVAPMVEVVVPGGRTITVRTGEQNAFTRYRVGEVVPVLLDARDGLLRVHIDRPFTQGLTAGFLARATLWLLALCWWTLTAMQALAAVNAWHRHAGQADYKDALFVVTDAGVAGRYGDSAYLQGEIDGQRESHIPKGTAGLSKEALLARFPIGTVLPVKFNTDRSRLIVQSQTPRVIDRQWDFASDDRHLRTYAFGFVLPSVALAALLWFTGRWRRKQAHVAAPKEESPLP